MTRRPLTDGQIADALLQGGGPGAVGGGSACVHEDRLWDLARGALTPVEVAHILDHTSECPDCGLALRVAHETFTASGLSSEAPASSNAGSRLWRIVAGSVLSPAPALAYLLLLALSFPLYRFLRPSSPSAAPLPSVARSAAPPAASGTPGLRGLRVLRLTGDLSLRGAGTAAAPARVSLAEGDALVLKLFPDADDLPSDPGAALVVRVLDGADVVSAATRRVSDLEADHALSLLLDRGALQAGKPYVVELAVGSAGPPILRQSFVWERG